MKSKFLKLSRIIACASLLLAYQVKSAVDTSPQSSYTQAVRCAENAGRHMKNLAKWNHDFIYSSKTYKQLLLEFKHCAKWFQDNVLLVKRSVAIEEQDASVKEMQVIVEHVKEMMIDMLLMLKELEKEKDPFSFLVKMRTKKDKMDTKLKNILAKIIVLKENCKNQDLSDLYKEVANMEKTIIEFREKNKGIEKIIRDRVYGPQFLK